jgi:hypothetical protein
MEKHIARLNIEHFRKKFAKETDEGKRLTLLRLLAEWCSRNRRQRRWHGRYAHRRCGFPESTRCRGAYRTRPYRRGALPRNCWDLQPEFSRDHIEIIYPFQSAEERERFICALRTAGLPLD